MKEKIRKFIINQIDKIFEKFPEISFKYGFDNMGTQHLIEVEPDTLFKNQEYMDAEYEFVDAFINEFPAEDLLFISNNKYIKVIIPIYVKEGLINVASDLVLVGENIKSNEQLISAPFTIMGGYIFSTFGSVEIINPLIENENNNIEIYEKSDLSSDNCNYALAA